MEKLWKKESGQSIYVDLFASHEMCEDECEEFYEYQSQKDNQQSTELRMKGNMKFRMGLLSEAMNLYNESVCFAEIGTENVALAYVNRAECFLQLKMYKEAVADIELAKNVNISKCFLTKLHVIEEKCEKMMATMENDSSDDSNPLKETIKLSYLPDKNFPCMANVVEIKENSEFGRHMVAKCDIPVGQTILIENDFVSMRNDTDLVCYTCYRPKGNFIACSTCTDVVFCNRDCMIGNLTHKWECGSFFPNLHYRMKFQIQVILQAIETFSTVESLMEFVGNVLREKPEKIPPSSNDAKSMYHFFLKLSKAAPFHSKYLKKIQQIYTTVMRLSKIKSLFDSMKKQRFLMHLILHHFLVIKTNSVISKSPWSTTSIFNVMSMLNHSCTPNLYHPRKGKQQYCVTIRPVEKGEQLFISYVPLTNEMTVEERKEKFISSWYFICKCEKCHQINSSTSIEIADVSDDPNYQFVLKHFQNENNTEKLSVLSENCVKFLNKYGKTKWSREILAIATIFIILYIERLH